MDSEKKLEIFRKTIIEDNHFESFSGFREEEVSEEEIKKATQVLLKDRDINYYIKRVRKWEDNRLEKINSSHCKICGEGYANFGVETIVNEYGEKKKKMLWYCTEHEALGKLISINNELKEKEDEININYLSIILKQAIGAITDKFRREVKED